VAVRGSVELAPRLDAAEAIVDLVQSGETLRQNGLRPIATVVDSEAVLVARPDLEPAQRRVADELATVVRSVIVARGRRYLMLNTPDAALDSVIADPKTRTPDMGGALGTDAFGEKVAQAVQAKS